MEYKKLILLQSDWDVIEKQQVQAKFTTLTSS